MREERRRKSDITKEVSMGIGGGGGGGGVESGGGGGGVSASTSLNEAVSPRLPLMCTENPDPVKCSGFWGWLKGGEGVKKQT